MVGTNKTPPLSNAAEVSKTFDTRGMMSGKPRAFYSALAKIMYKNLNDNMKVETFNKYGRDQIATYIQDPVANEAQLRDAVRMLYNLSPHFWRLIQYMSQLCDLSYVVSQTSFDELKESSKELEDYQKTNVFFSGVGYQGAGGAHSCYMLPRRCVLLHYLGDKGRYVVPVP